MKEFLREEEEKLFDKNGGITTYSLHFHTMFFTKPFSHLKVKKFRYLAIALERSEGEVT